MKRFKQFVMVGLAAVLMAVMPVSLPGLTGAAPVALAADCPSPLPTGDVQLSVPLFDGQSCISGDAAKGGVIVVYLTEFLQLLGTLVGAVIVLMLIIAGIQYITSAGDPGQVKAAKDRIVNAITALVLFSFMYAILNFLIPGGVFH